MPYEVRVARKADAELSDLTKSGNRNLTQRIFDGLDRLAEDPKTPRSGADILQLEAIDPKLWRLRVGQYRILYSIDEKRKIVNVTMILHRKKAYR